MDRSSSEKVDVSMVLRRSKESITTWQQGGPITCARRRRFMPLCGFLWPGCCPRRIGLNTIAKSP